MKTLFNRPAILSMAVMIFGLLDATMPSNSFGVTIEGIQANLPKKFREWSLKTEDVIYNAETIFDYINGGAEVYKAYNMRRCLSRRYSTANGPDIVLDIFDMGSSEDAYGVFTHDPEGDVIDLGQDGRFRPGWLNFWKDFYFVSIYSEEETDSALNAVRALGSLIDSLIPSRGPRPQVLTLLPTEGLDSRNIHYLHHPMILNYHYYIADENLLQLTSQTDAVLASYRRDAGKALILLVSYPQPEAASAATAAFKNNYLADADKHGMARLENKKWATFDVKDRLLVVVLESDSRQLANTLLKAVMQKAAGLAH